MLDPLDHPPRSLSKKPPSGLDAAGVLQPGGAHPPGGPEGRPEDVFSRLSWLATGFFDVDVAFVALLNDDRQWLREGVGPEPVESRLATSLCTFTIKADTTVVLENAGEIDRVRVGPLSREASLCFYAGAPIRTPSEDSIGAFAIMGSEPQTFSDAQRTRLGNLSQAVTRELRRRCQTRGHQQLARQRKGRFHRSGPVFRTSDLLPESRPRTARS